MRTSATLFGGLQHRRWRRSGGGRLRSAGAVAGREGRDRQFVASGRRQHQPADARAYRIRESAPGITKAAALARAQVELLRGTVKAEGGGERAFVNALGAKPRKDAPAFQFNKDAPYAHPYYWAPFFLMGNWL